MLFSFYLIFFPYYEWHPWNSTFGSRFGWYALGSCFHIRNDEVFLFIIWSMSFRYLLKSIKFVSYNYCISMSLWGSAVTCSFESPLFLHRLKYIFAVMILWSRYTFKKQVCLTVQSAIYPIFIYEYGLYRSNYLGRCCSIILLFFGFSIKTC